MRTRFITIITLLLSTPMVIAQKSMDEIDRKSFAAKPSPIEVKGTQMTETGNIPPVGNIPEEFSLDGIWQLAEGGTEKNACIPLGQIKYLPVYREVFIPHW